MGIAQGIWILYGALLTTNLLNEHKMTVAERYWILGKNYQIKPVYIFQEITLERKSENVLNWGRGYTFVSTAHKMLWIPSQLLKTRFDWRNFLKNLTVDMKKNQEKLQNM